MGFAADAGPVRQGELAPYAEAVERLREGGLVYACDCTRSTFAAWAAEHGTTWQGPGCPGGCRGRGLSDDGALTVRVALGTGDERWDDRLLGPQVGDPSASGDLAIRDRHANWTYGFAVVVDDLRQAITLVVRGEDLAESTAAQIRLGSLLGRVEQPVFAHHSLIRKAGGAKLSKADDDTGVRDLRAAGQQPEEVIGAAAAAVGLIAAGHRVAASEAPGLVRRRLTQVHAGRAGSG